MRLNSNTIVIGQNIVLVPYKEYHVPRYHEWMQSEELQQLTASEPLSLDEEYAMQKSWREDRDKCTFIILDKNIYDKTDSMIGDTNIFITNTESAVGEIEIMIAEKTARGKKFGWEAVILMLIYGIVHVKIRTFEAKISLTNSISIKMFEKLGFTEKSRSEVFKEITLEKAICDDWLEWLNKQVNYEIQNC